MRIWKKFLLYVVCGWFVLTGQRVEAFKQKYHQQMTERVLKDVAGFDVDSADEVADENWWTDIKELLVVAAHADDNQLDLASVRLVNKLAEIGNALRDCKREDALEALGKALHTVQDVYAHSNSIDNGIAISDILHMARGTAPCNRAAGYAPGGLVTGYFSVFYYAAGYFPPTSDNPCFLVCNECTGISPQNCCHRELNKDDSHEINGDKFEPAYDAAASATAHYIDLLKEELQTRFSPDDVTYFLKILKAKQRTEVFVIDDTGSMAGEIAGVRAGLNSYVDQLVVGEGAPKLGLVTFKDSPFSHGYTCDVDEFRAKIDSLTASGGDDCPEAMNSGILTALSLFPTSETDYALPGGHILVVTDASARDYNLGPIVGLLASAQGVSIDAVVRDECSGEAAGAISPNGMTDGSPNEFGTSEDIQSYGIVDSGIRFGLFADAGNPLASPIQKVQLGALTEQTGGVLFTVGPSETIGDLVPTLLDLGAPHSDVFVSRKVALNPVSPMVIDVPVDDTMMGRVTIFVTASGATALPEIRVLRPDGSAVDGSDPNTTILELSSVTRYAIATPVVGIWHVELHGAGDCLVRALATTNLRVNGLRLLDPAVIPPRPEIEMMPLEGSPILGGNLIADLRLTLLPGSVALSLRKLDGGLITDLPVEPRNGGRTFRTSFSTPAEEFVIRVSGETAAGNSFVRDVSRPFVPQGVGISVTPEVLTVAAGTTATFDVAVTNVSGVGDSFHVSGLSDLGWIVRGPDPFVIDATTETSVQVKVDVPPGVALDTASHVTMLVQSTSDSRILNGSGVTVIVGTGTPCGNGVLDVGEECDVGIPCFVSREKPCKNTICTAQCQCIKVPLPNGTVVSTDEQCMDLVCQSGTALEHPKPLGAACGNVVPEGPCDAPDSCNGTGSCDSNYKEAYVVCREAANECDRLEYCSGVSGGCPPNDCASAGTLSTDDGNECTYDVCDGHCNSIHPPKAVGFPCGNTLPENECDLPDHCDGQGTCDGNSTGFESNCLLLRAEKIKECLRGPSVAYPDPSCSRIDLDQDGDVDLTDCSLDMN